VRAGHPKVVGAGGDGTLNSVATALVGTSAVFGVLPFGTLNHFARDLGIPLTLPEAARVIVAGREKDRAGVVRLVYRTPDWDDFIQLSVTEIRHYGHDSIQIIFDWFDYQTHAFNLDDLRFGNPLKRDAMTIEDDRDVTLADLDLEHRDRFTYGYHFGEGWQVAIKVEKIGKIAKGVNYPHCAAGQFAGPPEDCGGLDAYHDMLACIKEPATELGREWIEWLGPDYDPELCDLEKINKALKKLGK